MIRTTFSIAAFVTAILLVAAIGHSVVVVDYNSKTNYNTTKGPLAYEGFATQTNATADFDGDGAADDYVIGRAFSTTVEMNPTGAGYDQTLPSAEFYGGYVVQTLSNRSDGSPVGSVANASTWSKMDIRAGDDVEANSSGAGSKNLFSTHLVQYWDKIDFLNGADQTTNVLGYDDEFVFAVTQANQNTPRWFVRWLVRDGSTFYISEENQEISGANQTYRSIDRYDDPSAGDGNWAVYDPFGNTPPGVGTGGLDVDFEVATATFEPQNFTNVTAVGFYVEIDAHSDDNKFLNFSAFSFGTTKVPEPATSSYLAFTALLGAFWAYRRRRAARCAAKNIAFAAARNTA